MRYTYYTSGTCSTQIDFEIDDQGILRDVQFYGGCDGNLQGISILARGMKVTDIISKFQGIRCGYKSTSCPDQLATALSEVMAKK